jgi:hypothetical protein
LRTNLVKTKNKSRQVFMKKKLLYGMIVLVSVSLFFLGCPTDSSGDGPGNPSLGPDVNGTRPTPGQAAKALAADLEKAGITTTDNGNGNLVITGATAINTPISVPAGVNLTVTAGTTAITAPIIVGGGAAFGASGGGILALDTGASVNVAPSGTLAVSGTSAITIAAGVTVDLSGTYAVANGTSGTNNGTIITKAGGEIRSGSGVAITGGTNIVEAGGKVYFDGDLDPFIGTDDSARLNLISGTVTATQGTGTAYILDGAVTLNDVSAGPDMWLSASIPTTLDVKGGSVLTIGPGASLSVYGNAISVSGTGAAPRIIIKDGGEIAINTTGVILQDPAGTPIPVGFPTPAAGSDRTFIWQTGTTWKEQ